MVLRATGAKYSLLRAILLMHYNDPYRNTLRRGQIMSKGKLSSQQLLCSWRVNI